MNRRSAILANLLLGLPLVGLLRATPEALAQTSQMVTIPFAFSADHQQVPPGTYRVKLVSTSLLSLCNLETAKTEILMVRPEGGQDIETKGRLVFYRDGAKTYLTQVRTPGTSFRSELMAQPSVQQSTAKSRPPSGSSIEVAMN